MKKEPKELYEKDGVLKLENFFDSKELKLEVQKFLLNRAPQLSGRDINFVDGEVNSVHALLKFQDEYFMELARKKELVTIIEDLFEDKAECKGAELFLKPAKIGLKSPLHQDDFYWCVSDHNALTVWVALDRANEENGGVLFYKGSHKIGLLDHVNSYAPGSSQMILEENIPKEAGKNIEVFDLQPGDCTLHHSLIIHGSAPNRSGRSRRGLTLQFKAKNSPYDLNRKRIYEERLAEQIKQRELQTVT